MVEDERKDVETKREKEGFHASAENINSQYLGEVLTKQQAEEEEKNQRLEEMLAKENVELQEEIQEMMREVDRVNREREDQRRKYDAQIRNKDDIVNQFNYNNDVLRQEIREMRSCLRLEQMEAELSQIKATNTREDKNKTQLQEELRQANQYIRSLDDKIYKANNTSLELLRQLKESETEIETLKHYIIELKQRIAVYIPVKDDMIDRKLAEYINNYPERAKLKIMFMRESEGIYQFGTKRVYVRVEKDKINSNHSNSNLYL